MRRWVPALWLAAGAVLLAAIPVRAEAPVKQWSKGDWWEVQVEQLALYVETGPVGWTPTFRLHFRVTEVKEEETEVEVTALPESRQDRLVLRYAPDGRLIAAQVWDRGREEPLGAAGSPGVFGMLGREAFDLSRAPRTEPETVPAAGAQGAASAPSQPDLPAAGHPAEASGGRDGEPAPTRAARKKRRLPSRVLMDEAGNCGQIWIPDACFWSQYQTIEGLPQRATLLTSYWRRRAQRMKG